jgi:hypothetical protein
MINKVSDHDIVLKLSSGKNEIGFRVTTILLTFDS